MNSQDIRLLSFDLDGTLLGNPEGTERFREAWERLDKKNRPVLCYNTGRLLEDTLQVIKAEGLPSPDYCICGVGTLIYDYQQSEISRDFAEGLRDGWDLDMVSHIMASLDGTVLQPGEFQNNYKSSWYLIDAEDSQIDRIRVLMQEAGLKVNVVYSSARDLDILPWNATKGNALLWLMEKLHIRPREVVVGGDTGNDCSMFQIPGVRGIIVANAMPELLALREKEDNYPAGHKTAEGIIEGLIKWGVFSRSPQRR